MATYNKFNVFVEDLIEGVHDFDAHTFKVMLTDTPPVATNSVKLNITEITAANGYTAGGTATACTTSRATGTAKATFADVTFTATSTGFGPFRYAVLYNDTPASPADPLIAWWDYGSSISLTTAGDQFVVDFDGTNGTYTIA